MKDKTFTRQELLDLAWSKPMNTLSKELGISDVGFAKICDKLGVPRPPQGHWNKIAHNKPSPKPKLPNGNYPSQYTVSLTSPTTTPTLEIIKTQERMEENSILVPDTLVTPHPWVKAALKRIETSKPTTNLIYLNGRGIPNISISKKQADRALRIFNTLLQALETRKIKFWLSDQKTWVRVNGEDIEIGMREHCSRRYLTKQEQVEAMKGHPSWYSPIEFVDEPNGKVEFFLKNDKFFKHSSRRVTELKGSPLETRVNNMVMAIYRLAEGIKFEREARRQREIQYAINAKKWEEERRLKQQEDGRMKKFTEWADSWEKANQLENFCTQLETYVQSLPNEHEAHAILKVAQKRIPTLNPLLNNKVLEVKTSEWGYYY